MHVRRYLVEAAHPSMPDVISYWYRPRHGWGTTAGAFTDAAVARFSSWAAAENALPTVFGTLAEATPHGYRIVSDPRRTGFVMTAAREISLGHEFQPAPGGPYCAVALIQPSVPSFSSAAA
jgi:hypothetical protein